MFSFRPIEEADFQILYEWLQLPHIKEWWDDGDDTLEKVREHYTRDPNETKRFILLYNNDGQELLMPFGYFQYYFQSEGIIGIDQFLADSKVLNCGIGTQATSAFIDMIIKLHSPSAIIIDPEPENKRAIRCYEKVGFQFYKTNIDENGKSAYMMRIKAIV